jgi:hypothetical protein
MAQNNGLISAEEAALTRSCMTFALDSGAEKVRITLSKSTMDLFATLNGSLDKVTHCLDRVLSICLFVDGRYGSFSINRLEEDELKSFIVKAIDRVRMMAQDPCRDLPSPSRTEKGAVSGMNWDYMILIMRMLPRIKDLNWLFLLLFSRNILLLRMAIS